MCPDDGAHHTPVVVAVRMRAPECRIKKCVACCPSQQICAGHCIIGCNFVSHSDTISECDVLGGPSGAYGSGCARVRLNQLIHKVRMIGCQEMNAIHGSGKTNLPAVKKVLENSTFCAASHHPECHNRARRTVNRAKNPSASRSPMNRALGARFVTPHQSATVMPSVSSDCVSISTFTRRPVNRSGRIR